MYTATDSRDHLDKAGGAITFGAPQQVNNHYINCNKQSWLPGIFDLAVRFADLDGDGRYVPNGFPAPHAQLLP
jgi:hypothetical protein